jgi:hypothetical protein
LNVLPSFEIVIVIVAGSFGNPVYESVKCAESPDCVPSIVSPMLFTPVKLLEPGFWTMWNVCGKVDRAHVLLVQVLTSAHVPP